MSKGGPDMEKVAGTPAEPPGKKYIENQISLCLTVKLPGEPSSIISMSGGDFILVS